MVSGVRDFMKLIEHIKEHEGKFRTNMTRENQTKFNTETPDDYRKLRNVINNLVLEWHTFESKQDRLRVILKGMHISCDPEYTKNDT